MAARKPPSPSADHRARLVKLRDQLATIIESGEHVSGGTLARIAVQYRATLKDIAAIDAAEAKRTPPKGAASKHDELKARRDRRLVNGGAS